MARTKLRKEVREEVLTRFGGRCAYCGCIPRSLEVDHLIPVVYAHMHPEINVNDPWNLMPACTSCNNHKTVYSLEEFRREVSKQVERARQKSVNFRMAERFGQIQVIETPIIFYFEKIREAANG